MTGVGGQFLQLQPSAGLLDHVLGLVIAEVVLSPEPNRVCNSFHQLIALFETEITKLETRPTA